MAAAFLVACGGDSDTNDTNNANDAGVADTGGGGGTDATCMDYCTTVTANCSGDNALYADMAGCMTACAAIATGGVDGDTDGNTLNCRNYHAGVAANDAATHCGHAGLSGGGVCGGYCEVYCDYAEASCTGDNALYADRPSCMSACAAFPTDGDAAATDGNSVQCRSYHASFPAMADAATHCAHASTNSASGVCGSPCEAYCSQTMANCSGADALYADNDACMAACAAMPQDGEADATSGNSVQCRTYHASFPAAADSATHCGHVSLSGGGVCGDSQCDVYCDFVESNCSADPKLFPGDDAAARRGACMSTCAAFPQDGAVTATDGDSVQCRIYHASFPAAADSALHCQHASTSGGSVCGTQCDAYCDQAMANCGADFADRDACMASCGAMKTGSFDDTGADSVECRTYHASFPAASDGAVHCPHTSISGGGVCGGYCEVYCNFQETNCAFGGMDGNWADRPACMAGCMAFPTDGAHTATSGNSVQCRSYHASFPAAADSMLHCPHSGADGAMVCQ